MKAIDDIQDNIIEQFSFFPDWEQRYLYLIDLGKKLPPLAANLRTEQYILHGCQSQVWFIANHDKHIMHYQAYSDAFIVNGLIALLLQIYDQQTAESIIQSQAYFIEKIGLQKHLSMNRSNGLQAMIQAIKQQAQHCLHALSDSNH